MAIARAAPMGALLKRELLTQLRRRRAFFWLLLLAGLMTLTIAGAWPNQAFFAWSNLRYISQGLLMSISMLLLGGSALFIPGVAAASVVTEKQQRSWDLLRLTLIGNVSIVLGKFFSAVGYYLLIVLGIAPLISVVFFLIGIDWFQWALCMGVVLMTAVTCGMFGVACSTAFSKTVPCIFLSYVCMIGVMGLPWYILLYVGYAITHYLFGVNFTSLPFSEEYFATLSPLVVLLMSASGELLFGSGVNTVFLVAAHFVYHAILTIVALTLAVFGVQRRRTRVAAQMPARVYTAGPPPLPGMARPVRLIPAFAFSEGRNPVYLRERRWGFLGNRPDRRAPVIAIFVAFFLISMVFVLMARETPNNAADIAVVALFVHGLIICCLVPTFQANAFTKEFDGRRIDVLRMTLLRPREIVAGKFRAGLRVVLLLIGASFVASLLLWLMAWMDEPDEMHRLFLGYISLFLTAAVCLGVTLCASLLAKSTTGAIVLSYLFSYLALFGFITFILFTMSFFHWDLDFDNRMGEFVLLTSPVMAYWGLLNDDSAPVVNIYFMQLLTFALVCFGLFALAVALYKRYAFRDTG